MLDELLQKKLRERFNPDGSLLRQHQLRMLEMLKFIDDVCRKYDIKYWLCSGTLLGAVRDGGFIPWDDDLDIEMLRDDYKKFVKAIVIEGKDHYALQTHQTDFNYFAPYGKLRDLRSCIKEDSTNDLFYKFHGAYIDVFIMEPSSSLILHRISNKLQDVLLFKANGLLKNKFIRRCYFSLMCILLHNILFPVLQTLSALNAKRQLRHTMGSGFTKPRWADDIFPLKEMEFEGSEFPVPGNTHSYLSKIYGDYLKIPDLDEIKVHTVRVEFYD